MNLLILILGLLLPALFGWLLIVAVEGRHAVLSRGERTVWALLIGPMLFVFLIFVCHISFGLPFTLVGFLAPLLTCIALLLVYNRWKTLPLLGGNVSLSIPSVRSTKWMTWILIVLLSWTVVKVGAGAYDLWMTPTYPDDSFNNWNMRAKVFVETKGLALEFATQNDDIQLATGINSYPPGVPLLKVWLTLLRGSWQEPVVNGLHLLWYVGLLAVFFLTVRRLQGTERGLIGLYALASLPLMLIQGIIPYADTAVACYLFLAISALFFAMSEHSSERMRTWMMLGSLSIGALLFTKNEGLILYTPFFILLAAYTMFRRKSAGHLTSIDLRKTVLHTLLPIVLVLIPWILFKWMNGLTFGNAKSIGNAAFSFHPQVLQAIWYMTGKEANFLILPFVFLASLGARWRTALRSPIREIVIFVLATIFVQFSLFIFVDALVTEAIKQTGLGRGLVHIAPIALLCVFLLWPPKHHESTANHS